MEVGPRLARVVPLLNAKGLHSCVGEVVAECTLKRREKGSFACRRRSYEIEDLVLNGLPKNGVPDRLLKPEPRLLVRDQMFEHRIETLIRHAFDIVRRAAPREHMIRVPVRIEELARLEVDGPVRAREELGGHIEIRNLRAQAILALSEFQDGPDA